MCGSRRICGWHIVGKAMRSMTTAVQGSRNVRATQACVLRRKKTLCAPACEISAPVVCAHHKYSKTALCATTSSVMLGEVTAPWCFCQAKFFHKLNASSVDLFVSGFVQSLVPRTQRSGGPVGRSPLGTRLSPACRVKAAENATQLQITTWMFWP